MANPKDFTELRKETAEKFCISNVAFARRIEQTRDFTELHLLLRDARNAALAANPEGSDLAVRLWRQMQKAAAARIQANDNQED